MWQSEQEAVFKRIKQLVTATPILQFYNVTKKVTIHCDASSSGLRAVLMQDGHQIGYDLKAITTTERYYVQIEKECSAIVFGYTKFDQ